MATTPTKTDWLDKIPQIDQANANHLIYGTAGFLVLAAVLEKLTPLPKDGALLTAYFAVLGVAILKKVWDHKYEGESWTVCVDKVLVTIAGALAIMGARSLGVLW